MQTPIHHRSWFPFVVGALTVSLVLLIGWVYSGKQSVAPAANTSGSTETAAPVSDASYRASASAITSGLLGRIDAASDDAARLHLVESAQNGLLALLVPADLKDVHLELVTALNLMRQGLAGDAAAYTEGRSRFDAVLADNAWLR